MSHANLLCDICDIKIDHMFEKETHDCNVRRKSNVMLIKTERVVTKLFLFLIEDKFNYHI